MAKRNWSKVVELVSGGLKVRFEPVSDVPGFSHRVIIIVNGALAAKDWLSDESSPTHKVAEYYLDKHKVEFA